MASPKASFALAESPSHLLHRAQQLASDRFAALAGERSVTLRQFAVLAAIAEQPGRSQTDLVSATGIDRSTLADMITRMEKRGWIIRVTAANDARANAVTLAAAGRAALTASVPFARAADEALLEALPRGERKALLETLTKLSAAADVAQPAPRARKKAAPKRAQAGRAKPKQTKKTKNKRARRR
ncbi:MAG: MarR family winged helix-turn-helix transcriptional regulator [Hyphomonadaceae bacterium]